MPARLLLAAWIALALAGAPPRARAAQARPLTVAAAASLRPALPALAAAFEAAHPGAQVRIAYGASGLLLAQLASGAPFDLLLSADADCAAEAVRRGLADGPAFTFAVGALAVWVPVGSTVDVERGGLAALAAAPVRRIALANPAVAPYGRAARDALERAGVWTRVQGRLVMGESVAQAAQLAVTAGADAALLPVSLARAPPLASAGRWWRVPQAHGGLAQTGVVARAARDPGLARAFAAFLAGDAARRILAQAGYDPPPR